MKKRYLGNKNHMEVHDLRNEHPLCQIREIKPEHKMYFDSLDEARRRGYDSCGYCIGGSAMGGGGPVDIRDAGPIEPVEEELPPPEAEEGPIEPERNHSQSNHGG